MKQLTLAAVSEATFFQRLLRGVSTQSEHSVPHNGDKQKMEVLCGEKNSFPEGMRRDEFGLLDL